MPPHLPAEDEPILLHLLRRKPSENVPLLLDLARRLAARRRPSDLLEQYARDAFVTPSALDQRLQHRFDGLALEVASDFEAILLSPLAPLGVCAAISPTNQDRAVSTVRGTEVVSDPTNVLALECARRLASAGDGRVRLCTVHQVTRAQRFEPGKHFTQHFRIFVLAEAGRSLPEHRFEVQAMAQHASVFRRLFDAASSLGCTFAERRADLLIAPNARAIGDRLKPELERALPGFQLCEGGLESNYYDGVRVLLGAVSPSGTFVNVADVGLFDWMGKLTSNSRHRFIASGLGLQMFPLVFRS
jgi:hypothetical protein